MNAVNITICAKLRKQIVIIYFPGSMIGEITFSVIFRARNMSILFTAIIPDCIFTDTDVYWIEVGSFSCRNCRQDNPFSYLAFLYIYIGSTYSLSVLKFAMLKPLGCFNRIVNLGETWQRMSFLEEDRALVFWRGLWEFGSMKTLALVKKDARVQSDHERLSHTDSCLFLLHCS